MLSPWCFSATLSSTSSARLSGVSGGSGAPPPAPPPPPSVTRLASELCSSLDSDGLRTSPEPEVLELPGAATRTGPEAEGQEGGSSQSGLGGGGAAEKFALRRKKIQMVQVSLSVQNQNQNGGLHSCVLNLQRTDP